MITEKLEKLENIAKSLIKQRYDIITNSSLSGGITKELVEETDEVLMLIAITIGEIDEETL